MENSGPVDEDDWGWVTPTEHECAGPGCGETIRYGEEVHVLTVIVPIVTPEGMYYAPYLTDDGAYAYDPLLFEIGCWDELAEEVLKDHKDEPAVEDALAVVECNLCESGVRVGEVAGIATFGEIHLSKRSPNHEGPTTTFEGMDNNPTLVCISCLNKISKDYVQLWADYVTQSNECEEGSFMRCWRYGCPANGECENA